MKRATPLLLVATLLAACGDSSRTVTEPALVPGDGPSAAITVTPSSTGATVDTDKEDYAPGEVVTIIGKGWKPGETVRLHLAENPVADGPHEWSVTADANGNYTDISFAPGWQHLGVTFTLTASGATSGTSVAVFTDGNVRVLTNGPTVNIGWRKFNSSASCAGTPTTTGTATGVATSNVSVPDANTGQSLELTAPPSVGAQTFVSWTRASTTVTNHVLCVVGDQNTQNWTANYTAPVTIVGTSLSLAAPSPSSVVRGSAGPVSLSATLTRTTGGAAVTGATVEFFLDAASVGTAVTNASGVATLSYDPSALAVGSHGIQATFAAASIGGTSYTSSTNGPQTLSVSDASAPVITPSVTGTLGNDGWYTGDVQVSWSVTDPDGPVTSTSGCDPVTVANDTNGQAITCTATSAGGTAPGTVTIKRDATAPTASASQAPAANAFGWNNTNVTVSFTGTDATSGIASCSAAVLLGNEGANQSASGTCTDVAGNTSAAATVNGVNIDKTAPTISGAATTSPNGAGWYRNDVTVHYTCTDALSGIASCTADQVLSAEGASLSSNGSATDRAGNTASVNVTGIKIDRTAPTVTATASPAANTHGWNNSAVTVSFTGTDALSGGVSCTPAAQVTAESSTSGQAVTGSCTDAAGNEGQVTQIIKLDLTDPTITGSRSPQANAFGWNNTDVVVSFTCTDAPSGIASCPAPTTLSNQGANQSVTGTARDNADNTATATVGQINIDRTAPVVSDVAFTQTAIQALTGSTVLTASIADQLSGGGTATYTLNGGTPRAMSVGAAGTSASVTITGLTTGLYNVCVQATDRAGNPSGATAETCGYLAVYDPSAGFVTGGGWITSPSGACRITEVCRGVSGKANFGFVSKYQNGARTPTGNTEFQFQAGNLNFKSTVYEWLTVSGPRAQYKGDGTINGAAGYKFILTAVDGSIAGGGGTDRFRIKIMRVADGVIVYDNMLGDATSLESDANDALDGNGTLLGGGSIQIKK